MAKPNKALTTNFPAKGFHIEAGWPCLPLRPGWGEQRHNHKEAVFQKFMRHFASCVHVIVQPLQQVRSEAGGYKRESDIRLAEVGEVFGQARLGSKQLA